MRLKTILTVICFTTILFPVSAEKIAKTGKTIELQNGVTCNSSIVLSEDGIEIPARTFSFRVPKSAYGARISIGGAKADLDLFVNQGSRTENYATSDIGSESDLYNESLFITRQSGTPLETGLYYVSVVYQYDYLPVINGERAEKIDFSITLDIIKADPETVLEPGKVYNMTLRPENGMFTVAAVDIPRGTDKFRIDVFNTDADIDIYVSMRNAAKSREEAMYASESMLGRESLVISGYPNGRLITGRYYISLLDQLAGELPGDFSIIVTLDESPPEQVVYIPEIPEPADSFDSALLSTVEVISGNGKGSGCLLTRAGHIITNLHVIKGVGGNIADKVYIAVSLSSYNPPVELFSARIIDYDEALDLAFLQIDKGRYEQELPPGYEFPYYRLGTSSSLRIGQPIGVIGYPEVGGTGSRTSITFTSGIVSGFETAAKSRLIKTDAMISSGNSGGAVINAYYELLGIPGYIMDAENDRMGYIYPVDNFPDNWIETIERANK